MTDPDRAEDRSRERKHDRAESVERIMNSVADDLGGRKYPVRSEELAKEYADQPIDMPNETESLGSVFDRLTNEGQEEFDDAQEVREALYGELSGRAGGENEANSQRNLDQLDGRTDDEWTDDERDPERFDEWDAEEFAEQNNEQTDERDFGPTDDGPTDDERLDDGLNGGLDEPTDERSDDESGAP